MPVNSQHPLYTANHDAITRNEAAISGDVKQERFVPLLSGQSRAEWNRYINRASYFNVTERTLLALVGAATRKPHEIQGADDVYTASGTFTEFVQQSIRYLLAQARMGIWVDFNEATQTPQLILYPSASIINWSADFIVLEEHVTEASKTDRFLIKTVPQWRVLELDENGLYRVSIHRKVGQRIVEVGEASEPMIRGSRLDYIPFYFCTPYDTSDAIYNAPLSSLADLNIDHFRVTVDLKHGMHFTALPQPWIAGTLAGGDPNDVAPRTLAIGTDNVWQLGTDTTVGYLEFSGAGLGMLKDYLKDLEGQMYAAGSRLLTSKNGVESVEALQLRAGAEGAALVTVVHSLQNCLNQALATYGAWLGNEVAVALNTDFTAASLDPATIKALIELYGNGVITLETFVQRLYDGEVIDNVAEELSRLKTPSNAESV